MSEAKETRLRDYVVTDANGHNPEVYEARNRDDAATIALNHIAFEDAEGVFVRAVAKSGQLYNRGTVAVRAEKAK